MLSTLEERGLSLSSGYADGAYDTSPVRRAIHTLGGRALIPPKRSARIYGGPGKREFEPWQSERDRQTIACRDDREGWKEDSGYHRRSLVESSFSRLKTLFGPSLYSRTEDRQQVEAAVSVWLLNRLLAPAPT